MNRFEELRKSAIKNEKTITLSATESQIFLVAKGHYKEDDKDSISVLKKVFCKLYMLDSMSDFDIYVSVLKPWNKYVQDSIKEDNLIHAFSYGFPLSPTTTFQNLTSWMLGGISTIKVINKENELLFDMEEKLDINS